MPTTTVLFSFNGTDGADPTGSLIFDPSGDLFGTTSQGGSDTDGTVFELAFNGTSYAGSPTDLATFDGSSGAFPDGSLIMDTSGDLFGTTLDGPDGTVFEIVKSGGSYNSTPTILDSLTDPTGENPNGSLITDANGDLFATTEDDGAGPGGGSVIEIDKTGSTYSSTPTVLAFFSGPNGSDPSGDLHADANGNLFGTTEDGGANGDGEVFEITKTGSNSYSSTPTTIAFNGADGKTPDAGLVADANGDLFGTTSAGGAYGDGEVFEIAKTGSSYATTPLVLASFDVSDGKTPDGNLIIDADGDLFGTTAAGGANGDGEAFEIAKSGGNYANTPTLLVSFTGTSGADPGSDPVGGLVADASGDLFGTTQLGGTSNLGTAFEITNSGFETTGSGSTPPTPATPTTTVLFSFNGTDGADPTGSLIFDPSGDLFGTTSQGGSDTDGTVFELAFNGTSYAGSPTDLATFDGSSGAFPDGSLIMDTSGDLFGTTLDGPDGTVFEIVKSGGSYNSTPTILDSLTDPTGENPNGSLITDANGDLFATTEDDGAGPGGGSVIEIDKTGSTYSSTPTVLAFFSGPNGSDPSGDLHADANGNLFGTTEDGGANGDGEVFEITKTGSNSYSSTPTTIAFNGADGKTPDAGLVADANGDLFGTTSAGGAYGDGEVFEIAKTGSSYATTPLVLASFDVSDGKTPDGNLIIDADGDLFGTTAAGGANGDGEAFEIAKSGGNYANTPTLLVSFTGTSGADPGSDPVGGLVADASGDLFGTTQLGGTSNLGTAFEITGSGFVNPITVVGETGEASQGRPGGGVPTAASGNALTGDTDANGATLSISAISGGTVGESFATKYGSITLDANGSYTYAVGAALAGAPDGSAPTDTITFTVADTNGATNTGTLTITDYRNPTTVSETGSVEEGQTLTATAGTTGTGALAGDSDPDGAGLGVAVLSSLDTIETGPVSGSYGTLTVNANGSYTYVADSSAALASAFAADHGAPLTDSFSLFVNAPLTASALSTLTITVTEAPASGESVPEDFYNNSASAIPLQNTDGQIFFLQEAGAGGNVGNYGAGWNMVGADSFYTDGNTDILLQNTDGQMYLLDMQGNSVVGGGNVGNDGAAWDAVATGGFFSDGDQGIALQNTDGQIYLLDMQDGNVVGGDNIGNYGSAWHVAATGDFFGDGNTDLVLQNTDGDIYLFDVRDTVVASSNVGNFGADWTVVGAGKFLSDGNTDLVLQNTDGQIGLMDVQDGNYVGFTDIGNFGASWQVKQVGDFFADGHSGIALQNTNGQIFLMELNGGTVSQSANLGNYGTSWHVPMLPG